MRKKLGLVIALAMIFGLAPSKMVSVNAEDQSPITVYDFLDVGEGAYIDTNYKVTKDTHVIMDVQISNQGAAILYGANDNYSKFGILNPEKGNFLGDGLWFYYGNYGGTTNGGYLKNERHTVEIDKNVLKIDGEVTFTDEVGNFSPGNLNMYLFAINLGSPWIAEGQYLRFYSCQIFEGENLIRDFVPATLLKDDNTTEAGVYDRQENKFYENQGNGEMEAYVPTYKNLAEGSSLPISYDGYAIDFDGTITVYQNTTIIGQPCQSAIYIHPGRDVVIDIKDGVTLNVWGGNASGRYDAGAGIEVPESSSLTIIGNGTLNAKGGDAASGENGENGGTGGVGFNGFGGKGGNGGGGAGAGLGGRGGRGGIGGEGGSRIYSKNDTDGVPGKNGTNGRVGSVSGNIIVAESLKGIIRGGIAFDTPASGGLRGDTLYYQDFSTYYYTYFGGGGGGGGGTGYPASGIGNGGAGGAGGGGSGSGLIAWWYYSSSQKAAQGSGHKGLGGAGAVNGLDGSDFGDEANTSGLVAGTGGKGGTTDAGNFASSLFNPNYVYLDEATKAASETPLMFDVEAGAYFDTGYKPVSNTRVVFKSEINNKATALFGLWYYNNGDCCCHVNTGGDSEYGPSGYGSGFGYNATSWAENSPVEPGNHTIELSASGFYYDGNKKDSNKNTYFPNNSKSIYICAINLDGEPQTFEEQRIRFYSCQIFEGYRLVSDFIPIKSSRGNALLDRQKGLIHEKRGNGNVFSYNIVDPEIGLTDCNDGAVIDFDGKITVSKDTTITALPTQSGIYIDGKRNVTIEILEGVTLTVRGGNAVNYKGAGAGIELPIGAKLTITGSGTLDVKGGDADIGENGSDGGNAWAELNPIAYGSSAPLRNGAGGKGGYGGGGAGAGIGGKGGNGGFGGKGAENITVAASTGNAYVSGNNGENGENGHAGFGCGEVTISKTINAIINGGSASSTPSSGGKFGNNVIDHYHYTQYQIWTFYYCAYGGGGGGAGGNGFAGAKIGFGGDGGAGGGGGGSGFITYWDDDENASKTQGVGYGGLGGAGSATGNKGEDKGVEVNAEELVAGRGGSGGTVPCGAGRELNISGTGSIFSEGNIWIVIVIAGVALAGILTFVIIRKNKKTATAGSKKSN